MKMSNINVFIQCAYNHARHAIIYHCLNMTLFCLANRLRTFLLSQIYLVSILLMCFGNLNFWAIYNVKMPMIFYSSKFITVCIKNAFLKYVDSCISILTKKKPINKPSIKEYQLPFLFNVSLREVKKNLFLKTYSIYGKMDPE